MGGQTHSPRAERERRLAMLATDQHGVLARRQLLQAGLGKSAIDSRVQSGRLLLLHRGVYAVGHSRLTQRGRWMAAVLACGEGAALSHSSAAALWGLMRARGPSIHVTSQHGRGGRTVITLHRSRLHPEDRTRRDGIPVTSLPRTLLDLADVVEEERWGRAAEEAERLGLLEHTGARARLRPGAGTARPSTLPQVDRRSASGVPDSLGARGSLRGVLRQPRHPTSLAQRPRRGDGGRCPLAAGAGDRRTRRIRLPRPPRGLRARSRGLAPPSRPPVTG